LVDAAVALVFVGKRQPGAERDLGADDAVPAVKVLIPAEHVHGAALAPGIAAPPAGQFRHHALGVHAAGQHVSVVAVRRDDGILRLRGRHHADDNGFLADIEMTEAADQAHAVKLAGLFLEAADHQHLAIEMQQVFRRCRGALGLALGLGFRRFSSLGFGRFGGLRHSGFLPVAVLRQGCLVRPVKAISGVKNKPLAPYFQANRIAKSL